MNCRFRTVVFLTLCLLSALAPSSAQRNDRIVDAGILAGQAIRNYPDFPELNGPALLATVKYAEILGGSKPWHRYYNNPYLGFQLVGGSLGNDAVLGHMAGAMADMRFPLKSKSKFTFSPVLSIGASWFSKPYDEETNSENFIIGSSVTFLAAAAAEIAYKCSPRTDLVLSMNLLHASNAHYQLPNVGLNMPMAGLTVRYHIHGNTDTSSMVSNTLRAFSKKPALNIRIALGMNEQGDSQGPVNGPKYPIYLGSVFTTFKLSPVNKIKAGVEMWYNSGVYDYIVSQEFYEEKEKKRSCAVALMFGHEFLLGHFGVVTDVGCYVYNKFYQDKFDTVDDQSFREELKTYIPARMGFQYYLKDATAHHRKNLYAGIYIKSNMGQADFLETGLGYTF